MSDSQTCYVRMTWSRRDFLKLAGVGTATLGATGACRTATPDQTDLAEIALQLYSVRTFMEGDTQGTLGRVAGIGYRNVETAFWPEGVSHMAAAQLLRDTGLKVIAAHVELPFGEERDIMLRAAEAYDCTRMVWHGWPEDERYGTLDGTLQLAELYHDAQEFAAGQGLELHLHNHWWEFEPLADGQLPYYVLLEQLAPEIQFELDTWWIKVAGQDPAQVVGTFGNRAPLLHIKDATVISNEGPMVAAGQGMQDFEAVAVAGTGHTKYMIVELDSCETDMFDAVTDSYRYLTENGLARA